MDRTDILAKVDHTLLKQTATLQDITKVLEQAMENNCASACIPPCFVSAAKKYVGDNLKICTVIGFPNGNMTTATKVFETKDAIYNGADEIDMVVNINLIKDELYDRVLDEIKQINAVCRNSDRDVILKVIIETCLLTEEEIRKMCEVVYNSGADYIKTSTGFSTGGATSDVVSIMADEVSKLNATKERGPLLIKAAGGIKDFDDAEKFIELGASRLGTSRLIS